MSDTKNITGVILAGGAGRRMGGRDKGLVHWRGRRLVEHVHERLLPQVDDILISCNRNRELYSEIAPTVSDRRSGYQGPLAGIEAAASLVTSNIVVIAACDTPLLPLDLVSRLTAPLIESPAGFGIAYAHDGNRPQYLFAAVRHNRLAELSAFLDTGHRAVREWMDACSPIAVDFSDELEAFANVNSDQPAE